MPSWFVVYKNARANRSRILFLELSYLPGERGPGEDYPSKHLNIGLTLLNVKFQRFNIEEALRRGILFWSSGNCLSSLL